MGEFCGHELTLLGIDILGPLIDGKRKLHADLNEQQLLDVLSSHKDENGVERQRLLLLSQWEDKVSLSAEVIFNFHPRCTANDWC